ncbi:hypothetical protein BGX34_002752 [Mortierella sp. NVP85]|nr:hypothetical protein BGX34_002752 [Mortierella sp. NVP85]
MDGSAFTYFAPYLNNDALDSTGILHDYQTFMSALERLYGNKNKIRAIETKLMQLRQSGDMADYITQFQTLSAQLRWNEEALVARFKEGLSAPAKKALTGWWDTLFSLGDCHEAYQVLGDRDE